MRPLLALVAVTVLWGVTFVQVKDALELYPLFAFLAVRFAIASAVLAVPARTRLRGLGRDGAFAGIVLGVLLAAGYGPQTAGLERTTVSSTGFITGLYVVLSRSLRFFSSARLPPRSPGWVSCFPSPASLCSPGSTRVRRPVTCSSSRARSPRRSKS